MDDQIGVVGYAEDIHELGFPDGDGHAIADPHHARHAIAGGIARPAHAVIAYDAFTIELLEHLIDALVVDVKAPDRPERYVPSDLHLTLQI